MKFSGKRYRVVKDEFCGFEAQHRPWWSPFWVQMTGPEGFRNCNSFKSVRAALEWVKEVG